MIKIPVSKEILVTASIKINKKLENTILSGLTQME
jgi:hypothetical protein